MPRADLTEVAKYLRLCWQEELAKLKGRLDDVAKKARIEVAEKTRVDADNATKNAELTMMRQRVPPPPLSRSPFPIHVDSRVEDARDAPLPLPEMRPTPSPDSQFRTPKQNRN
jgi:hypothetical protein